MADAFCPKHGPYDASFGSCPYCAGDGGKPSAPRGLDQDDMPTDYMGTTLPPVGGGGGAKTDEMSTQLGENMVAYGGRPMDVEEAEETSIGQQRPSDVTELDRPPAGFMGLLWAKEGPNRGKIYRVVAGSKIGRDNGDIILDDPKVSSLHAKFTVEKDLFVLWDMASTNGTFVNGKQIRQATPLEENDLVKIGDSVLVMKLLDAKKKKAAAAPAKRKTSPKKRSTT